MDMNKLIKIDETDLKTMVNNVVNKVTKHKGMVNENTGKSYLAIGFATKFYTLWTVTEEVEENETGVYEKTYCHFLKNISMDFNRAKEKYPEAVYVSDLRGHTSFFHTKCIEKYGEDEFKGGKYAGEKITDCKDYNYLLWAWDKYPNVISYGARDLIEAILDKAVHLGHATEPPVVTDALGDEQLRTEVLVVGFVEADGIGSSGSDFKVAEQPVLVS